MTQQTLRKEVETEFPEYLCQMIPSLATRDIVADFFLARFKEFAEKELIKENDDQKEIDELMSKNIVGNGLPELERYGLCVSRIMGRNALRNEQRKILAEFLK